MFKVADKEKSVIEKMKGNRKLEKLIVSDFPMSGRVSVQSQYSPSSSCFCLNRFKGFVSSDDGLPLSPPLQEAKCKSPNTHNVNGLWLDPKSHDSRFLNEHLVDDELGLCQNLCRMNFQEEPKNCSSKMRGFDIDPQGFGMEFLDGSLSGGRVSYDNRNHGSFDGSKNDAFDYEVFKSFPCRVPGSFGDDIRDMKPPLHGFGLRDRCEKHDSMGSYIAHNQFNDFCSSPTSHLNGVFVGSQQCEIHTIGGRGAIDPFGSPLLMHPKLDLNMDGMFHNGSMLKERTSIKPNIGVPQSLLSITGAEDTEAFSCYHSFIIPEKISNHVVNKDGEMSGGLKKNTSKDAGRQSIQKKSSKRDVCYGHNPGTYSPPSISSLATVQGHVYFMAKDQYGCRFLQRVCDEGTPEDVQIIFNEIIINVVELMMEPFGNYLVQKLLDVCNEDQITQIVLIVTKEPGQLVKISLNTYGTRVVQRLIETLKTRQQILSVKLAIQPGFLHLIKDLNGNHVIQRCLQCLSNEDNKFIFNAAAKFCVDMATHQHGCCVLQRCIGYSTGQHRDKLLTEVCSHGLHLAQDPYGNYVVQFIIDQKSPSANAKLHSQFKGHYVHLSMQKFSSHVVEKCLKNVAEIRPRILHELLAVPHFEQLLQDPFANYVIQSALKVTKGPLHDFLVQAVRPHRILRTNPYSKRIFSRNLLKK